jgi:putative membrane protein
VRNVLFFVPVGIGGVFGVFLISHPMSFLLKNHQAQVLWFFVGTILGTLPDIWQKSGEKGRKPRHIIIMILTFIIGTAFLLFSGNWGFEQFRLNPLIAFLAGSLIAIVILIPGLSSSNFLVLFGLYESMIDAYKNLDFTVIIPFFAGLVICIFPFSKGIEFLFKKTFTGFFHFIAGIVLASTVLIAAIASDNYNYLQIGSFACVASLITGIVFAYQMCQISKKYETK